MHLPPRQDPSLLLKKMDEEFVRKNPIVREEVLSDGRERNRKSVQSETDSSATNPSDRGANSQSMNGFTSHNHSHFSGNPSSQLTDNHNQLTTNPQPTNSPKRIRITENSSTPSISYASDEEMSTLPQMKKVGMQILSHVVCEGRAEPNSLRPQSPQIHFL